MTGALARELDAACAAHGSAAGLSDESGSMSLPELAAMAGSVESALRRAGCLPDEPVAVTVSNRARDVGALWGIWKAGAVAAPLHRTAPPAVAQGLLDRLQARFVVNAEPALRAPATQALAGAGASGTAAPLTVLDRPAPAPRPLLHDAALIVFTSGTTGQPKGAVLSHTAFSGKLAANQSVLNFAPGTRTLLVLQITFSFGMWVSLLTLSRGGWLCLEEGFKAPRFFPALAAGRSTDVALVPTMIRALLASAGEPELRAQVRACGGLAHVRRLITGGENLGPTLGGRVQALFPQAELCDIYGLTETSTSDFFLLPAHQRRYAGCIGGPAPGVSFRIVDEAGRPAAPGEPGELQIRTPYLMSGYLDAPELTQAASSEGYFRTGDIAREREPGMVELVGRSKELISRGANKVSPLEIEQVCAAHPAVAEALATGIPDPVLGERIHVFVVPRAGAGVSEAELVAWCAARLERYKCPDRIHFGTALPLGPTGKSDRIRLRQVLAET